MKKVPSNVVKSAPPGTEWFGGSVDKIVTSLRVSPIGTEYEKEINHKRIEDIIGKNFEKRRHGWSVKSKPCFTGDLDKQVRVTLNKLPKSKKYWDALNEFAKIDLFVGVFLERANRGIGIDPSSMQMLAERNIVLNFDIYGPGEL